jgi:hypothetical protein
VVSLDKDSDPELPTVHCPLPTALPLLASLVDKSLLRQDAGPDGEPRFRMLETIREFGLECLEASGEADAVRAQHARWCFALVEQREGEETDWLDRLEREHDNLRGAGVVPQGSGQWTVGSGRFRQSQRPIVGLAAHSPRPTAH